MKMLMAIMALCFATGGFLAADPAKENCTCTVCKCTQDNHCGCMAPKEKKAVDENYLGCKCGNGCKCGSKR